MLGRETLRPGLFDRQFPAPSVRQAGEQRFARFKRSVINMVSRGALSKVRNAHACSNGRYTSNASEWVEDTVFGFFGIVRRRRVIPEQPRPDAMEQEFRSGFFS
jgi:hypothetical protein